ncbi:MAG: hypothetical protein U0836_19980 [Pirellulales bacterium]
MQLSHFWVAAVALCAGLFLSCLRTGSDRSETIYPEANRQGVAAQAASGLDAVAAQCRAEFARFEAGHAQRTHAAASTAISTPRSRQLLGDLRAAADSVTARMHEFERQLEAVAAGDASEATITGLHAAANKVHDARVFYDGLAERWDSLSGALAPK